MDEKRLYVLAIFDAETQRRLSSLYGALRERGFAGTQTEQIPYHFTMHACDLTQRARLCALLDAVARDTACVDFRFDHLGVFGTRVIIAEPNMNYEILDLEKRFCPECTSGDHFWTAHATLLMDEPENIMRALPLAVELFEPFRARIEKLSLYEFFPSLLIKTVDLK